MNIAHSVEVLTPSSNTGYDLQKSGFAVGIDWLDCTFKNVNSIESARQILKDVEAITSDPVDFQPWQPTFNGHSWDGQGKGMYGTRIWYLSSRVDECCRFHSGELKIAMSGSVLARCDIEVLALYLKRWSVAHAITCQRIDIALDDYDSFINLDDVLTAHEQGNFFNASYSEEVCGGLRGKTKGRTIYFGSPKSDKRMRWYDKFIESQGKQPGNRAEAQFRRKPANLVFYQWLDAHQYGSAFIARLLQNIVLGTIDFRQRDEDDTSRERCPLLEWYKALLDLLSASPARITIKAIEQTVQKSIDWISRSVSQSLAVVKLALKGEFEGWLSKLIIEGGESLNNKKRYLGETTDANLLYYEKIATTTIY